jgi:hypothetical protein
VRLERPAPFVDRYGWLRPQAEWLIVLEALNG